MLHSPPSRRRTRYPRCQQCQERGSNHLHEVERTLTVREHLLWQVSEHRPDRQLTAIPADGSDFGMKSCGSHRSRESAIARVLCRRSKRCAGTQLPPTPQMPLPRGHPAEGCAAPSLKTRKALSPSSSSMHLIVAHEWRTPSITRFSATSSTKSCLPLRCTSAARIQHAPLRAS